MFNPLDFIFKKRITAVLGIDIGTSSIKIAELRREEENRFRLLNYAILEMKTPKNETAWRGLSFDLKDEELAKKIQRLRKEAGMDADSVVMSLPVFSTFVTLMEMPVLDEKELASAVPLQAREYIPIPISEVVLDWKLVRTTKKSDLTTAKLSPHQASIEVEPADGGKTIEIEREIGKDVVGGEAGGQIYGKRKGAHSEVLLMAAPREMVQKYVRIAQMAGLTLLGLEIESFALARSAINDPSKPTLLLDLGAFSSSVAVFDEGYLRMVHGLGISSLDLTRACSRALGTDLERAEAQKVIFGLFASGGGDVEIVTAYVPLLEAMARDIERVISAYWRLHNRQITEVVISGNTALLKGLDRYIASRLQIAVRILNPFERVILPKELSPPAVALLGPGLANAVGLAMKEI